MVPHIVTELPGPRARALLARDARVISPSYTRGYPLVARRAEGLVLEDVDGNTFLDFTAGIAVTSTGHCHPRVVEAIRRQAGDLVHMSGTDFYYEPQVALAERLARAAPGDAPKRVFLANSGTEAIEAAIKLVRWRTRRTQIIAFHGAFHGRTLGALSLTCSKAIQRSGFGPMLAGVVHVPFPDPYRPPLGGDGEEVGRRVLAYIRDVILGRQVAPSDLAAIFVEPIQGEGGYVVPPPGFLAGLAEIAREAGALLVADEIQCGMGRTGRLFACEHEGVVPDVVCLAKGIASGLPLGAMIAGEDLMQWPPGAHASTFGGNPVCCAAALATLDLLEGGLVRNAAETGAVFKRALEEATAGDSGVGQVRGRGLMLAVEFVTDRASRGRDRDRMLAVVDACFRHGLLVLPCGANNVRFSPALTVSPAEVETAVRIFAEVLAATSG